MKGQRKKKWGGNIAVMSFDALYIERERTHSTIIFCPSAPLDILASYCHRKAVATQHISDRTRFFLFQIGQRPNTIDITKGN